MLNTKYKKTMETDNKTIRPEIKQAYEPPHLEIVEVIVERGFQDEYVQNHEQTY